VRENSTVVIFGDSFNIVFVHRILFINNAILL